MSEKNPPPGFLDALIATHDMVSPVSEDVQDILNKYGPIGAPIVYAAMKLGSELLWETMDEDGREVAELHSKHMKAQRIRIRRRTDENQE